jgi:hypothetical protein
MSAPQSLQRFNNFSDFYPFYLGEHANLICRRLHFIGSTLTLAVVGWTIYTRNPYWLFLALFCGYGFAWVGHFFFEHNRPATFKYPLYSFMGDWVMYAQILTGKVKI